MNTIILVLKGLIIGLGKVIPGISGSLLAVSLNVYEEAIHAITTLFKDFKKNIIFLGTLGVGILIAIIFGSKVIMIGLNYFYLLTMLLFIGFIIGVIPNIYNKCDFKKNYMYFILSLLFVILLGTLSSFNDFIPNYNLKSFLIIILIGFIDALTMIIPGISGTAIFMILGYYPFVLKLFSNILNVNYILYYIFFGIGLLFGIFLVSWFMNFMFKNYRNKIYMIILGFTCSSIFILIKKTINSSSNILDISIGIILLFTGYKISKKFSNE